MTLKHGKRAKGGSFAVFSLYICISADWHLPLLHINIYRCKHGKENHSGMRYDVCRMRGQC